MGSDTAGVVFYVIDDDVTQATEDPPTYKGKALLHAVVEDLDLWEKVVEQLHGMELHRGRDFKTELIEVLRGRNAELEEKVERSADDRNSAMQQLMQQLDAAERAQAKAEQDARIANARAAALADELASLGAPRT